MRLLVHSLCHQGELFLFHSRFCRAIDDDISFGFRTCPSNLKLITAIALCITVIKRTWHLDSFLLLFLLAQMELRGRFHRFSKQKLQVALGLCHNRLRLYQPSHILLLNGITSATSNLFPHAAPIHIMS